MIQKKVASYLKITELSKKQLAKKLNIAYTYLIFLLRGGGNLSRKVTRGLIQTFEEEITARHGRESLAFETLKSELEENERTVKY